METFVGLDLSLTGTGITIKQDDKITLDTIKTTPKTAENDLARLNHIVSEIMGRIPTDVRLICVEDFFTPHNAMQIGAAIKLAMLGTAVRLALYNAKYPFYLIAPSQLKKFVTGKGVGDKSMILKEVYKRWGIEAKDDNAADSCVLSYMAEALVKPDDSRPSFQKDVVKTILAERPKYNC